MEYALRIPTQELNRYQHRYDYQAEVSLEKYHQIGPSQGYLTVPQLHEICRWKSKRRAALANHNSTEFVREITSFAFSADCERSRLGALTLLEGVHFPTASVILHFCLSQSYPILDVRALWSLSIKKPTAYTLQFWDEYVGVCRELAHENGVSVRGLDMALWQYSREHQPRAGRSR
jgi:hypothetical protein